jgi:hypothetical protein
MIAATPLTRLAVAALFALLLAARSLAPAGFMPAFDHGAVTIVACPDAGGQAMSVHHKGHHKSLHQPCPYASAASLGALGPDWTPLLTVALFAMALRLGRTFLFVERQSRRERPPLRAPPIPA